jgi:hypothetical protein
MTMFDDADFSFIISFEDLKNMHDQYKTVLYRYSMKIHQFTIFFHFYTIIFTLVFID